jgi:hypothetical protein
MSKESPAWFKNRGFNSSCRVCCCWSVQNHHWVSFNPNAKTITEYSQGYFEDCIPSDNLEYLEWCYDKNDSRLVM